MQTCLDDVYILAPHLVHQLNISLIVGKLSQKNFARFNSNFSCNKFSQLWIKISLNSFLPLYAIHFPGCDDPPITFIVERLTDLLNLDILISAKLNVMLNLVCHMREWNLGGTEPSQLKPASPVCCAGYDLVLIMKTGLTSLGSQRSDPLIFVVLLMIFNHSTMIGSWPLISLLRIGWKEGERRNGDNSQ